MAPVDAYCYLHARFGKPNGLMMLAVPPDSENIFHWHWSLRSGDETIEIQGVGATVEYMIASVAPLTPDDGKTLTRELKADFARFGAGMKEVRQELEKWTVFVNPYFRLERIVADLHARLAGIKLHRGPLPDAPDEEEELTAFQSLVRKVGKRYADAVQLGTSLRMISPVWAESFVNLVIFLLSKPEVRNIPRLYDDLLRREIDVRIMALHLHCDGFTAPVDRSHEAVRDFLTVMNSRNDMLHGNVDPKRLAVDEIYFAGKMPIFKRRQTLMERVFDPQLKYVEPDAVILDIYRIEAFIDYVLSLLEPDYRESVKRVMGNQYPGWRADTGRPGILFGDMLVSYSLPGHPRGDA